MKRCARCGTAHGEVAWSVAAHADLCLNCYRKVPEAQYVEPTTPAVRLTRPKPYRPSESQRLIGVWQTFLKRTGMPVFNVHPGAGTRYVAWCPVCEQGIVTVAFPRTDPPVARLDGCTAGCTPEQIVRAI